MPGRYVPPHLRGRGGSSDDNNRNTSTSSSQGSRWRNLEGRDNNNSGKGGSYNNNNNRYNHQTRYSDRRTASNASSNGKSRWANVNRSAIEAGNHSSSRFQQNHNHNNNRRFHHDNRHSHNKLEHIKAIFFGDSFIKLFGLLNDYSDSILRTPHTIEVQKYKAASAKGLCREGNDNRSKILRTTEQIRRRSYPNLERLVFCFGSVDVHMSFYYKKFVQQQPLSNENIVQIAHDYIDFVASLETDKPITKLIVGIYPSPLCDKDVGASLLAYGSLETEDQVTAVNESDDKRIELRQERVDLFNKSLKDRCEHHNQQSDSNGILEYWDARHDLLTIDETTDRFKVKDAYKDVSDLNIHLIHETTLQLWVQKWPWYQALTTSGSNHPTKQKSFVGYLQETFDEYRKTKPWAERTHVAETRGIQLSL